MIRWLSGRQRTLGSEQESRPTAFVGNMRSPMDAEYVDWTRAFGCLVLMLCYTGCYGASEWNFSNEGLLYRDTLIDTALGITREDTGREGGALFNVTPNSSESHSLLEIISPTGRSEVWLFDNMAIASPRLLGDYPTDMQVGWISDCLFQVGRRHMGTSVSVIYAHNEEEGTVVESVPISDLMFVDPDSALIARLQLDSLHTSKVWIAFSFAFGHSESRVPVEFEYEYASHVLDNIADPDLRGCEFSFVYSDPVLGTDVKAITIDVPREICGNN